MELIAVQAELRPETYASAEAFRRRVLELCEEALASAQSPRVIAFPEAFGLPLLFWLEAPRSVHRASTALQAAVRLVGLGGLVAFYHLRAPRAWQVWQATFAEAARWSQAYLLAGSLFAPRMDEEPSRDLRVRELWVRNWSLLFNPEGRLLAQIPKLELTSIERQALLRPGHFGPQVLRTRWGTLGVLVCLDAFHEGWLAAVDGQGAQILLQPSANPAAWDRPWPADPGKSEGRAWVELARERLRGREHLRYLVNPMLNGELYELRFEGQSGIYGPGTLLAQAERPVGDRLLRCSVEL
jgi:predicted amidohydrolase